MEEKTSSMEQDTQNVFYFSFLPIDGHFIESLKRESNDKATTYTTF